MTTPNTPILDELLERVAESHAEWHKQVPSPLFHYTSADGLVGILRTKSLWLTDLRYMNDLSELQYSRSLVATRLKEFLASRSIQEVQREFLGRASASFDPFRFGHAVYSASFCENGNLLSQWRAYRGRGGGYALGIDFFHTLRFLNRQCVLRKVIYKVADQTQLVDKAIESFLQCIAQVTETAGTEKTTSDFLSLACSAFAAAVGDFLFTFKHPDFHEEQEWRLVHFANVDPCFNRGVETPCFRTYEGNVIPYFEVSFDRVLAASRDDTLGIRFPFSELVIGPTVSADLNQDSVATLLLSLNADIEPRICRSEIPLRWL